MKGPALSFKNLLLQNHWANFNQTRHSASLGAFKGIQVCSNEEPFNSHKVNNVFSSLNQHCGNHVCLSIVAQWPLVLIIHITLLINDSHNKFLDSTQRSVNNKSGICWWNKNNRKFNSTNNNLLKTNYRYGNTWHIQWFGVNGKVFVELEHKLRLSANGIPSILVLIVYNLGFAGLNFSGS